MVQEHRSEYPPLCAALDSIAPKVGCVPQTLHKWLRQSEIDEGVLEGVSTSEAQGVKEMRRASEILKLASA